MKWIACHARRYRLLLAILLLPVVAPSVADADCDCGSTDSSAPCQGSSVSITEGLSTIGFEFNCEGGSCACGKWANDTDYWVAPSSPATDVTITAMTPAQTGTPGTSGMRNGWQLNPVVVDCWGFDGRSYNDGGSCDGSPLPITVATDAPGYLPQVWMKAESEEPGCDLDRHCVKMVQPLTVLDSVPAGAGTEAFRPPFWGATEKPIHLVSEMDTTFLPELPDVLGNGTSWLLGWDSAIRYTRHILPDFGGESTRSEDSKLTENYGIAEDKSYNPHSWRWQTPSYGMLLSETTNGTDAAKKVQLGKNAAQRGIDYYYFVKNGGRPYSEKGVPGCGAWMPNGGHAHGRLMPTVLGAHLLDKPEWIAYLTNLFAIDANQHCFGELGQTVQPNPAGSDQALYGCTSIAGQKQFDPNSGPNSCAKDPAGIIDLAGVVGGSECPGSYMPITWTTWRYESAVLQLFPQVMDSFPAGAQHWIDYTNRMYDDGPICNAADPPNVIGTVSRCDAGTTIGQVCQNDSQCGDPGGNCAKASHGICIGGTRLDGFCDDDGDCPSSTCGGTCRGGSEAGNYCDDDVDCPGSTCDGLAPNTFQTSSYDDPGLQLLFDEYRTCAETCTCAGMEHLESGGACITGGAGSPFTVHGVTISWLEEIWMMFQNVSR